MALGISHIMEDETIQPMRRKRVTIEDVARHAGVSKVTVSYVLNGRRQEARISENTEAKVLGAVQDLGYRPNALARMLIKRRTDTIAIAFQYGDYFAARSSFSSEVMRGVCQACIEFDQDVYLHTKAVKHGIDEAYSLSDGRVDGVLALRDSGDPTLAELMRMDFPLVLFFTRSGPGISFVDTDNVAGGRLATDYLIGLGHKKIGLVSGISTSTSSNDRGVGFRMAMQAANLEVNPRWTIDDELENIRRMLASKDRPSALFVWSDEIAFDVLKIAADLGISVPNELSIIGFDSTETCEHLNPPLTSMRQPIAQITNDAVRLLVSQVRGERPDPYQIMYPASLDIRGSTAGC